MMLPRHASFLRAAPAAALLALLAPAGCHSTPGEPTGKAHEADKASPSDSGAGRAAAEGTVFRGVWASGPREAWAVGEKGTILHLKGDGSTKVPADTTNDLLAAYGAAPDDAWVTGEKGTIAHFDGNAWKLREGTKEVADEYALGLWLSGPKDAWVAGVRDETGELSHYDGTKWETSPIGAAGSLWAAGGSGPKDVWMVGTDRNNRGFVLRGDGKKFDRAAYEGGALRAVYAASPTDAWVGGYDGALAHWDGKAWAPATAPAHEQIHALWGSGPRDVWAVGAGGATLHFDGGTWTRPASGTKERLWAVSGTGPGDVWAVGAAIVHWDGERWQPIK